MLPESPFGPLVGYCQRFFEGKKETKGKEKEGAASLTHKPGCRKADNTTADTDEWRDSDSDDSDDSDSRLGGESRSSTPAHPCSCRMRERTTGVT